MKLLTLDDYIEAGEKFFPKYYYVMGEMGEDAKPEDVLKVMEAVGGLALKMRLEKDDEVGPFGFNKKPKKPEEIKASEKYRQSEETLLTLLPESYILSQSYKGT